MFFANASSLSATSTFAPASANNIEAALPFPMSFPTAPPPATMATLSLRPKSRGLNHYSYSKNNCQFYINLHNNSMKIKKLFN